MNRVYQDDAGRGKIDVLINTGETETGWDTDATYLLAGRACEPTAEGIKKFAEAFPRMRELAKTKRYQLSTIVSIALVFLIPIGLFALLAFGCWIASLYLNAPTDQTFKNNWILFSQMGNTFQGLGTLFVAIAVAVAFITYSAQLNQFALQQKQANEAGKQLLETVKLQSENLKIHERQADADLLVAKVHSLTSRIQGYEAQIAMVRATMTGSMIAERRTEEDQGVKRMRSEQHHLYLQLDRVLDDLKIGTKAEVPPAGTYGDPFA